MATTPRLYSSSELAGLPLGYDLYNSMLPALSSQWAPSGNSGLYANWMDPSVKATNEAGQDSAINSTPSQAALDSLNGYQFAWNPQGPANSGTLLAYKDGKPVQAFGQADTGFGQSLLDWASLAAIGFGGLGLAGAGPMAAGAAAGGAGSGSSLTGAGALDSYAAMDAAYGAAGAEGAAGAAGAAAGAGAGAGAAGSSLTGAGALDSYAAMDAAYGGAGAGGGTGGLGGLLGSVGSTAKDAAAWMKANPTLGRLLLSGATSLATGLGGRSSGASPAGTAAGSNGPAKQWTSPIQQGLLSPVKQYTPQAITQLQPQGLLAQGQKNDGAWRFFGG